jgi:hypothetical protein
MNNLKKDIKNLLKNECLSCEEKIQLKNFLRNFINRRNIMSRPKIDYEYEEDPCFGLDTILNNIKA